MTHKDHWRTHEDICWMSRGCDDSHPCWSPTCLSFRDTSWRRLFYRLWTYWLRVPASIERPESFWGQRLALGWDKGLMFESTDWWRRYPWCVLGVKVLPPLRDVTNKPEVGNSLRNKLVRLMTHIDTDVKDCAAEFLFVLCKESGEWLFLRFNILFLFIYLQPLHYYCLLLYPQPIIWSEKLFQYLAHDSLT